MSFCVWVWATGRKKIRFFDGMTLGLTTTPGQIPYPRVQYNKPDYLKREKYMKFAGKEGRGGSGESWGEERI